MVRQARASPLSREDAKSLASQSSVYSYVSNANTLTAVMYERK